MIFKNSPALHLSNRISFWLFKNYFSAKLFLCLGELNKADIWNHGQITMSEELTVSKIRLCFSYDSSGVNAEMITAPSEPVHDETDSTQFQMRKKRKKPTLEGMMRQKCRTPWLTLFVHMVLVPHRSTNPAPAPRKKGGIPPIFGPCPLWPNGWMD